MKIIFIIFIMFIICATQTFAVQTIFDDVNITKNLTIAGLKVASCDVKANLTGWLYCGSDAGAGGINVSTTTCSGTNKVSAINNATGAVTCSADTDTDTFNTTAEMRAAVNSSALGWYNLTAQQCVVWDGLSAFPTLYEANISDLQSYILVSSEGDLNVNSSDYWDNLDTPPASWTSTFNSTYDAKVSDNTSWNETRALAIAALTTTYNSTYDAKVSDNTSWNETRANSLYVVPNPANISNSTVYFGNAISTFYWNRTGNIPFSNITDIANCSAGQVVQGKLGNAWVCVADATGGAGGVNYWQTDEAAWMWANETAGGYNLLNVTTVNATDFYQGGNVVCDDSDNCAYISDSAEGDLNVNNSVYLNGKASAYYLNGTNTSIVYKDAANVSNNSLFLGGYAAAVYHRFSQTITWGNLSSWNLNSVWTGTLGGGNITSGTVTATQLASTFAINLGNITNPTNCTGGNLVQGKVGNAWVCTADLFNTSAQMIAAVNLTQYLQIQARNATDLVCTDCITGTEIAELGDSDISNTLTASDLVAGSSVVADAEVDNDITIVSTKVVNTTLGVNATALYSSFMCFNPTTCTSNITFNGTHTLWYG